MNITQKKIEFLSCLFDLAELKELKRIRSILVLHIYEILQDLKKHPEPDMEDIYRYEKMRVLSNGCA